MSQVEEEERAGGCLVIYLVVALMIGVITVVLVDFIMRVGWFG